MKFTKHLILSAVLATGLTVQSQRSEAMVGLATIPGSVLMVPVIIGSAFLMADGMYNGFIGTSGWKALFGLLLFDKDTNEIEMQTITPEMALEFGLSKYETESYNTELETINLALSEMNSTLTNSTAENLENAKVESLEKFKNEISGDSFKAVQKILKAAITIKR